MAAPVITAIVNVKDGIKCDVTLDRTLGASPAFKIGRIPSAVTTAAAAFVLQSGTTYRVTAKNTAAEARELWYIIATDVQGDSAAEAVWIRLNTDDIDINEVGKKLASVLVDNRKGIEKAMRSVYASATLGPVAFGGAFRNEKGLHIAVNPGALSEEYYAAPFYRLDQLSFLVQGYFIHESPTLEIELISAAGRAAHLILGQQAYETITLSSGLVISGIQGVSPTQLQIGDVYDGQRFIASFQFSWHGEWGGGGQ